MKRLFTVLLAVYLAVLLAACTERNMPDQSAEEISSIIDTEEPTDTDFATDEIPQPPFEGKLAIITNSVFNDVFYSAKAIIEKYGEDKIIHVIWPTKYTEEQKEMVRIVEELGADPKIKAIVVNTACMGTTSAFEKFREKREDVFVVFCAPDSSFFAGNYAQTADLILMTDDFNIYPAIVRQAYKLGAEAFVHYLHQSIDPSPSIITRQGQLKQTCNELGLEYAEETYPLSGYPDYLEFIQNDFPKLAQKYGKNAAFFSPGGYHYLFINAAIQAGVICPLPNYPSLFYGIVGSDIV